MRLVGQSQVRLAQLQQELHQGGGSRKVSERNHDAHLGQIKLHLLSKYAGTRDHGIRKGQVDGIGEVEGGKRRSPNQRGGYPARPRLPQRSICLLRTSRRCTIDYTAAAADMYILFGILNCYTGQVAAGCSGCSGGGGGGGGSSSKARSAQLGVDRNAAAGESGPQRRPYKSIKKIKERTSTI